jgi:hypothetical protein
MDFASANCGGGVALGQPALPAVVAAEDPEGIPNGMPVPADYCEHWNLLQETLRTLLR